MYKEDSVYDYIINSINNIITNGISYYADKDIDKLNCLMDIYDYINGNVESIIDIDHEELDIIDDKIEERIQLDNIMKVNDHVAEQVKSLTDDFMSKMTDIKINILNLENDLSLYYESTSDDDIEDIRSTSVVNDENAYVATDNFLVENEEEIKLDDELLSVNTIKVKDLSIDGNTIDVNDVLDMDKTIVEENETGVADDTSDSLNESSDLSSEVLLSESENVEKIQDDSIIDLYEEEVSHNIESEEFIDDEVKLDTRPRKHSILDLFRKKNG